MGRGANKTGAIVVGLLLIASAGRAQVDDVSAARQHYLKGTREYDLGHYLEAVKEYEAAYKAKDDPALLFNIAQAYRLAGKNENAIRAFKSYLHRVPRAPNRAEVETRIAELQKAVDQQARAKEGPPEGTLQPQPEKAPPPKTKPHETPTPSTTTVEPPPAQQQAPSVAAEQPPPRRGTLIAGATLAAVGVGALATGIAFGVLAQQAGNDLTSLDQAMGTFSSATESSGKTDQIVEGVMIGIGAAAVVAGTVLLVLHYRGRHHERASARPVAPLTAGLRF
jgi:tetratricopeptide (TPR) repeat protein